MMPISGGKLEQSAGYELVTHRFVRIMAFSSLPVPRSLRDESMAVFRFELPVAHVTKVKLSLAASQACTSVRGKEGE
jgi:hypothetical protein